MDQKKKLVLLSGVIGVVLIAVLVVVFVMQSGKEGTTDGTPAATAPGAPPPAMTAPSTPPPPMPAMAASAPTAPPPGMMPGQTGAPAAPGAAPVKAAVGLVDPFKGGLPRIEPPKPKATTMTPDMPAYVPMYPIPGVTTKGGGASGGGSTPKSKDEDFFFGAVPPTARPDVMVSLGRSVGWIATDGRGHVTAYFEQADGTTKAVTVGSVIAGRRVRAIEGDYLVLVDETDGHEERIKLGGARGRTNTRTTEVNVTPALPTWNGR